MNTHVLFIQGEGGKEDHKADAKFVNSLQEALGKAYSVHYPFLPDESSPDFGRGKQIGKEISFSVFMPETRQCTLTRPVT